MEENINIEIKYDASISIAKRKIKDEIRNSSIPLGIKHKRIFNEISQEMGFICPEYCNETLDSYVN
ncbi:hypothetical protein H8356DRAFT_1355228 [Neocallimastix lanati (nom. inval.)]|nr:hypothetical protein H8356DRAFT_1355228 [Neocallimastix sp. JGI-2020a]